MAGAGAGPVPGEELANVNLWRYYNAVFGVAEREVWRVFDWLHRHHYRHKAPAYVGDRLAKEDMKHFKRRESEPLHRREDPATMEIPLLYLLLMYTCGLRREEKNCFEWNKPGVGEEECLEHQLYLIKEKRNDLAHKPRKYMTLSDSRLNTLFEELREKLCWVLREAGQRAERPIQEVEEAVTSVKERLASITASMPASAIEPREFTLLARGELQQRWEQFSLRTQQLCPPLLRWALGGKEVALGNLLDDPEEEGEEPPRLLAVVGETGIGKSSLCWQVVDAWLQGAVGLGAVEAVVMVECREVITGDLTRLLVEDLLPQTCRRCQPHEVQGLLGRLRVLWLLDGYEEARAETRQLLRRLFARCGQDDSHTVIVTCQPEYREDLSTFLPETAAPRYVVHCGLTQLGFCSLLLALLKPGNDGRPGGGQDGGMQQGPAERVEAEVMRQSEAFMMECLKLDPELQKELRNPLKLELAVRLWEEGRFGEAAGASFSLKHLYAAIQHTLQDTLAAKVQAKTSLVEVEARERVQRWVQELCGVALSMWGRGRYVVLDEEAVQLLRDSAMRLMLPSYTDCFSTFLVCRGSAGPQHNGSTGPLYSFRHHTQQSMLAAQHLCKQLLQGYTTQEVLALLLPSITADSVPGGGGGPSLDHFMDILVHTAAGLTADGRLSQREARVLAQLMGHCSQCLWLEVLRHTGHSPALAREVRPFVKDPWDIHSPLVQAAALLAAVDPPAAATIFIMVPPDTLPHLMPLLQCLAKAPVKLNLQNIYSFGPVASPSPCDSILQPLCDPASQCILERFEGTLTADGLRALGRQEGLAFVLAVVLDLPALEEAIQLTHKVKTLREFTLYLPHTLKGVANRPVAASPGLNKHIILGIVAEGQADQAAALVRSVSHSFRSISLFSASPGTVCKIVKDFQKEHVKTKSFCKIVWMGILNQLHFIQFDYFSLPLPAGMTRIDVYKMWQANINLQVTAKPRVTPHGPGAQGTVLQEFASKSSSARH